MYTAVLICSGCSIVADKNLTKLERCAIISRLAIAATGLGIVFLPVDLIATLVKAVQRRRQSHAPAAI